MKYAAGDWIGLLIFVGVVIFQIISHLVNSAQEKAKKQAQSNQPPTPPRQRTPQQPQRDPEEYTDPFDELLEALGKKPGQMPPQLPHPPQQTAPSRPLPPLTPAYQERPVFVPAPPKPAPQPEPVRQPASLSQSAPEMVTENDTARVQAALAEVENKPVFETHIGSEISASQLAAENIAKFAGASNAGQIQKAYRPVEVSLRVPELVARLRNPVEIRRAIVAKEILDVPVALR
ncbi:MAG: hypothetical protein B9S32_00095 [Verrucomicrobia bacterium Tous-C9LFEB]|nr:MAG: hypothetical protein B9S32_00095 [Verrucomicrobia bacterium Tous-C9LFEB]